MQNPQSQTVPEPKRLDWTTMVVPFLLIIILCLCFLAAPDASKAVLENLRGFLGENFGVGYLAIGLGIFLLSIYIAFSRYGTIRLGKPDEKPLYSNFAWGSMMFTSGLAADILFYSLCEWVLYANDPHLAEMGSIQDWASTYPLFHWGPIPWSFYVVLAAAFGFMLHVRGCHKQKYSEACRPILGKHTDGLAGTLIDLMAVFALLAGTTTTFTLATPLMSQIVSELFGFSGNKDPKPVLVVDDLSGSVCQDDAVSSASTAFDPFGEVHLLLDEDFGVRAGLLRLFIFLHDKCGVPFRALLHFGIVVVQVLSRVLDIPAESLFYKVGTKFMGAGALLCIWT